MEEVAGFLLLRVVLRKPQPQHKRPRWMMLEAYFIGMETGGVIDIWCPRSIFSPRYFETCTFATLHIIWKYVCNIKCAITTVTTAVHRPIAFRKICLWCQRQGYSTYGGCHVSKRRANHAIGMHAPFVQGYPTPQSPSNYSASSSCTGMKNTHRSIYDSSLSLYLASL